MGKQTSFGVREVVGTVCAVLFEVVLSFFADIKWYIALTILVLLVAVVVLSIQFYDYQKLKRRIDYLGIVAIEKNMKTGTTTNEILRTMKNTFFLAGRGASRFMTAPELKSALERVDSKRPARVLILCPDSKAPCSLSNERGVDSQHISTLIQASLKTIDLVNERDLSHPKIIVRYYSNPDYKPIFRVVSRDDHTLYVAFYKRRTTGEDSFQLVLEDNGNDNNLYVAFQEHFESLWEVAKDILECEASTK